MSGVAVAVTVVGTAASIYSSQKQASAQKKQIEAQRRMADIENARQRREAVRQARIARASVISQGEAQGVSSSTGIAGGVAGVQQQMGYNLSFLDQMQDANTQAAVFGQKAADYGAQANMFGQIASTAYNDFGGKKEIAKVFK